VPPSELLASDSQPADIGQSKSRFFFEAKR
jgi:hypothetical protein